MTTTTLQNSNDGVVGAIILRTGQTWTPQCESCSWKPNNGSEEAQADYAARIHNSEIHTHYARPEWAEVSRWADEHRGTGVKP